MSIRLVRPSEEQLRRLLRDAAVDSLTYEPSGISGGAVALPGYRIDRWSRRLGDGELVWQRACDALANWQVQRGAGLAVCAEGPPAVGTDVAMSAPLPVGHIDAVCRVVSVVDRSDRFGFAYGTLSNHPEQGEESFTVVRLANGGVGFEIVAASRPRRVLVRAFGPIARHLQRSATTRYLDAMTRAAAPEG